MSIYLINSVTRYIILDGGSFNKQKDGDCITLSVIGVKQLFFMFMVPCILVILVI